ncbi:MAG: RNA polymerase sigma factor [Butyricicoccus sp.]
MELCIYQTTHWRARLRAAVHAFAHALNRGRAAETADEARRELVNRQAERLLDTYGNSVLRLAYSYLHNRSDAEDILQDTLIQFLKTAPALESAAHEKAWMLRVAANLCKNRLDYNRVRDADELQEELTAECREDLSFVWEAVQALPAPERAAIHLFHHEGYSTAQIAQILNRKEATVRSDLRRGRQKLKEILKEAYDFGEV